MAFTLAQQRALAVMPKVTGFASLFFSALIVFTVGRDKRKRSKPFHRLLCGISLVDMSSSFWLALSTWPIPEEEGVLWAVGTTQTCTLQGFFTQFGITSSFYNASLSLYYLLFIRCGWKESRIRKVEPYLHGIPLFWGLSTAITGLPLTLYNNAKLWCWIASLPSTCSDDSAVECIRGEHADIYRWALFYGPLWCMILVVTINVILIFHYVWRVEKSSEIYRFAASRSSTRESLYFEEDAAENNDTESNVLHRRSTVQRSSITGRNSKSKKVASRCFMYAGAFYFNWIFLTIVRIRQTVNGDVSFALLLLASMTTPIQGLPNFLVYLGPKFKRLRHKYPNAGFWNWFKSSLAPDRSAPSMDSNSLTSFGDDAVSASVSSPAEQPT